MADPFIGQIILVGFNFAPRGYAFCNGQILAIAQNTALFSLLGTTYGGNGQTTFALPNLQSRVPVHFGQGPGLSSYALGQAAGTETATLTVNQIPAHNHTITNPVINVAEAQGNSRSPVNAVPALEAVGVTATYSTAAPTRTMAAGAVSYPPSPPPIGLTGGSQPFGLLQPYLAINFCIALEGIFPSRN